ncbi:TetR family transcriptional regulator [Eubacteriaceae bacterium ES2]|nr:TetR family transcriptional regulator [Eubacteriaceae bacterium ES2]
MAEFIRARSLEQKQLRINEIMETTEKLFLEHTYHEITLTTIAEALHWSRGNLYKYVTTKEEIFLELYLRKQEKYFSEIEAAFTDKNPLSTEAFAELWTNLLVENIDLLHYYSILTTIIETNVSQERLVEFKKKSNDDFEVINQILSKQCMLSEDHAAKLYFALLFHANGLNNVCSINPLVSEAMKIAGLPVLENNFAGDFYDFMMIFLRGYQSDN